MKAPVRRMFKCNRCGHQWMGNKKTLVVDPLNCALCGSPYWNKKRVFPKKEDENVE